MTLLQLFFSKQIIHINIIINKPENDVSDSNEMIQVIISRFIFNS